MAGAKSVLPKKLTLQRTERLHDFRVIGVVDYHERSRPQTIEERRRAEKRAGAPAGRIQAFPEKQLRKGEKTPGLGLKSGIHGQVDSLSLFLSLRESCSQ